MNIVSAGKAQKGDVVVTISEPDSERRLLLSSTVQVLFGARIEAVCVQLLDELEICHGLFVVDDYQAFDSVIRARLRCAIARMAQAGGVL